MVDSSPLSPRTTPIQSRQRELRWGERTYVMGIVNVTPDSFSGDGLSTDVEAAVAQAHRLVDEGADIIDIGGESTRPGPNRYQLPAEEELRRVMPIIERLAGQLPVPISIDTYKVEVARQALAAGVNMINDVWGLKRSPQLADLAAKTGVPIIVMHNQLEASYTDLVPEVLASLRHSVNLATAAGVSRENIIIDPGIGFGKTLEHNLEIMRRLPEFKSLEQPILIGTSRKSMIGLVLDLPVEDRLEGTAATVAIAIAHGVDMVRVHDVRQMVRVVRMSDAIVRGHRA